MSAVSRYILLVLMLYRVTAEYYFTKLPTDTDIIEGMPLHLQCEAMITSFDSKRYSIHWQLNRSAFIEDTRSLYSIDEKRSFDGNGFSVTSSLIVKAVSRQNEASYRCKLYSTTGPALISSNDAKVRVIPKPRFSGEPTNVSAIEGKIATLQCSIEAVDLTVMSVKWTRGNQDVVTSQNNITISKNKGNDYRYSMTGDEDILAYHLKILKVTRNDTGIFQCCVYLKTSSEVILKSRRVMLDVLYPPDEIFPLCNVSESKKYSEGDIITTECISGSGNGPLRLSWIRNDVDINRKLNVRHTRIRHTWKLTPDDNGANITCVMKGEAILNSRQCVIGPLDVYFTPIVSITPKTIHISIDQSVTFNCSVIANPQIVVTYTWFLNGEQLTHLNSNLTINSKEIEKYVTSKILEVNVTCRVSNANSRLSDTAIMNINSLTEAIVTIAPAAMKTRFSTVILCTVTVVSVALLIAVIFVVYFICIHRRRTRRDKSYDPSTVQNDKNVGNEYLLEQSIALNERIGSANTLPREGNVSDIYAVVNMKKKLEDRALKETQRNSNFKNENIGLQESDPELVDSDLMEEEKKRKQRNLEGLVYAELNLTDNGDANDCAINRKEPPVIYAELKGQVDV